MDVLGLGETRRLKQETNITVKSRRNSHSSEQKNQGSTNMDVMSLLPHPYKLITKIMTYQIPELSGCRKGFSTMFNK